jgi:protein SCO1/2
MGRLACLFLGAALPLGAAQAAPADIFSRPWRWIDEGGQTVTLTQWRGKPFLLTMFYRTCEQRCGPSIGKLKELQTRFGRAGKHPEFLLVTLDPRSDTPARLRAFKSSRGLDRAWHLLNGPALQTRQLTQLLQIRSAGDDAHIEHDTRVFLFDARGNLKSVLTGWSYDVNEVDPP